MKNKIESLEQRALLSGVQEVLETAGYVVKGTVCSAVMFGIGAFAVKAVSYEIVFKSTFDSIDPERPMRGEIAGHIAVAYSNFFAGVSGTTAVYLTGGVCW